MRTCGRVRERESESQPARLSGLGAIGGLGVVVWAGAELVEWEKSFLLLVACWTKFGH